MLDRPPRSTVQTPTHGNAYPRGVRGRPAEVVEAHRLWWEARIARQQEIDAPSRLGRIPVLKARMNADLHMADELKNTGKANLFKALKAEIEAGAWASLYGDLSRPFDRPESGRIAVKVINHLGDEVMKVFQA